jgi:flagellar biosynthetic protein FlhB
MSEDVQEKTEEATSKKLLDSRKKGQVAKSQDFTSSTLLFVSVMSMYFFAGHFYENLISLFTAVLTHLDEPYNSIEALTYWFRMGLNTIVIIMIPLLATVFITALLVNVMQVGFTVSMESLNPKWKQINIFNPSNFKKFFNTQAVAKLCFGMSKLSIVGLIVYLILYNISTELTHLMKTNTKVLFYFICWNAFQIAIWTSVFLIVLGIADFAFQKWKFSEDMKMSKQEIKDERKQSDGDPQLKSKMRSMMQGYSQSRMKEAVPHADVVVANPIHYAIAIKYDADSMAAPVCVAKGARKLAIALKEIAKEHNVPIVENPPLAQTLYKTVEVGRLIPPNLYNTVAEVLAYVYGLSEKMKKKKKKAETEAVV